MFDSPRTDREILDWLAAFDQTHKKRIFIPEWAVDSRSDGHGLGDDPTFINVMCNWFVTHHAARSIYFIDDARDNSEQGINFLLAHGHFPKPLAASRADFG